MSRFTCLLAVMLILISTPLFAWGPHTEITLAALDVLDDNDPIKVYFGEYVERLPAYAWMPDFRGRLRVDQAGVYFYPNDFLLFPDMPRHIGHVCPQVRGTFVPYFNRALQALRSETQLNAIRWVGSLVHFTEDVGAPPHAAGIGGALHRPMENWLDRNAIDISGYKPRLLGRTDQDVLDGYLRRMDELINYSIERAERIRPLVMNEAGEVTEEHRSQIDPLIMESALESARATADLLYTLGRLDLSPAENTATIRGYMKPKFEIEEDNRPAKIVLLGTNFSTTTDGTGYFEIRNLPPGRYQGRVMMHGCSNGIFDVILREGETRNINITLLESKPKGNLLSNGDLRVRWVDPNVPEGWYGVNNGWTSQFVPVTSGEKYVLHINWLGDADAEVRWYSSLAPSQDNETKETPMPSNKNHAVYTAPQGAVMAQIFVRTSDNLMDACQNISFAPANTK